MAIEGHDTKYLMEVKWDIQPRKWGYPEQNTFWYRENYDNQSQFAYPIFCQTHETFSIVVLEFPREHLWSKTRLRL